MPQLIPIFPAEVADGKIHVKTPIKFKEYVSTLAGKKLDLILRPHKQIRSLRQNAYYWGVYIPLLAAHYGYSEREMHGALKMKFLINYGNSKLPTIRSTASLTTQEFYEYMEKVDRMAAEDGIKIPIPEEYYDQDYACTK